MSDTIAAVSNLANMGKGQESLQTFYDTAKANQEDLVIDKWFAIQASVDLPDAIEKVHKLVEHPDFSFNPNRFRAVVGTFAGANPRHFHTAQGYDFVTTQILALDKKNPQVAARLTNVFATWRRYKPELQALMQAALTKIKDEPNISKDTFEIATKSLK